jgi:hypothetical protein
MEIWHTPDKDWVSVEKDISPRHKIELKEEDGDDIKFWLTGVAECATWGEAWTWDYSDFI